ncbi:MAG TPA: hypothetical protein VGJ95_06220 [Pseudonocardiaceae bacterium]|jgi:predicted DNA-binding protein
MKKQTENLPRPAGELEALAAYYDTHDTSSEMKHGEWVDPRPMKTTSLRLPAVVVDALKDLARERGVRYTALVREIVEDALTGVRLTDSQLVQINDRLARIEAAVLEHSTQPAEPKPKDATKRSAGRSQAAREGSPKRREQTSHKSARSVKNAS